MSISWCKQGCLLRPRSVIPAARRGALIATLHRPLASSTRIGIAPATVLACVCIGWSVAWLGHAPGQGVLCMSHSLTAVVAALLVQSSVDFQKCTAANVPTRPARCTSRVFQGRGRHLLQQWGLAAAFALSPRAPCSLFGTSSGLRTAQLAAQRTVVRPIVPESLLLCIAYLHCMRMA